jgi:hypothetical protein
MGPAGEQLGCGTPGLRNGEGRLQNAASTPDFVGAATVVVAAPFCRYNTVCTHCRSQSNSDIFPLMLRSHQNLCTLVMDLNPPKVHFLC